MRVSRPSARLTAERLEDRAVPAVLNTWVNDNWHLFFDADSSGGLTAGDLVTTANDPGTPTGYTWGTQAFGTVTSGIGVTAPLSPAGFGTIQDAVSNTLVGGTVNVLAGTYEQDVNVNLSVALRGAGAAVTTLRGAIGGDGATVRVGASNVTVSGLTITRAGNTVADWNNPDLNSAGVAVQGQAVTNLTVRDNILTGNRTAIDVNDSSGHTIRNNVIAENRTGLLFRNRTDNLTVTENAITDNFTVGVLFLDASGGTNSPVQQALGSTFTNNNISGNWFGQIVDRQAGGALPAPGANLKNFSGNWFGTAAPTISTANSAEPGYAAQIPVQFGGTATRPTTPQPDVLGPASANFVLNPLLATGTDTNVETAPGRGTLGFQGNRSQLAVAVFGPSAGGIQAAIDAAPVGGTVSVGPGTYVENIVVNKNITLLSASGRGATTIQGVSNVGALGTVLVTNSTTGVTIGDTGRGFTIVGIDNGSPGLENAALYFQGGHTNAQVRGNEIRANGDHGLLSEFGQTVSGFVIDGNIFSGQTFVGPNPAGSGFGQQFDIPNVPRQLVLIGSGGGATAGPATNITFTNNQITGTAGGLNAGGQEQGNGLVTLDVANSTITGNTFDGNTTRFGAALRVRRPGTTISGNTFDSAGMGAGTAHLFVQNTATPLETIVAANTFDRATFTPGAVPAGGREVSTTIGAGVARTPLAGTLNVLPGTYVENVTINRNLTLQSTGGRAVTTIQGVSGVNALGTVLVTGNTTGVTLTGFTIVGIDNGNPGLENAALYFQGGHTNAQVRGNDIRANGDHGLLTEFGAALSGFVIDGNVFSGKAYTGSAPAVGNQFEVPNVARTLVFLGTEGTDDATNIAFTNNQITGDAAGVSATPAQQANALVTLNAANSTVAGNTFAGTATGSAAALRVTRSGTTISGNTFVSTNMGPGTEHLSLPENTGPLAPVVAANTFDRGTFLATGTGVSASLGGGAAAAPGGATLNVLPGTYAEGLNLTATGPGALNKALTLAPAGGTVALTGDLALDANDTIVLDLSATPGASDALSVGGSLTLGGTLTVNNLGAAPAGAPTVLIAKTGPGAITGTFSNLADGATVGGPGGRQFTVGYAAGTGNDLALTPFVAAVLPPSVTPPVAAPVTLFAAVADLGGHVKAFDAAGTLRVSVQAFPGFAGAVSVASGDLNGDSVDDIVVGAGAGAVGGHVKAFDGATGAEIRSFFAFPGFAGGVTVAVADGDIVVGAGAGAPGGHVKVFDGTTGAEAQSFFAFAGFTGGVSVAAGDFDGDGDADLVVGTAAGASHVKVFDGATGGLLASFFAFDGFAGGVRVAAGDFDGDGAAELVVGTGLGAAEVRVFGGRTAAFGGAIALTGTAGARVAVGNANADAVLDILVGAGGGQVRTFDGRTRDPLGVLTPFDGFTGGVSVG